MSQCCGLLTVTRVLVCLRGCISGHVAVSQMCVALVHACTPSCCCLAEPPGCLRNPFLKTECKRVSGLPGAHPYDSGHAACPRPALREQPARDPRPRARTAPCPLVILGGQARPVWSPQHLSSDSVPWNGGRALLLQKRGPSQACAGPPCRPPLGLRC